MPTTMREADMEAAKTLPKGAGRGRHEGSDTVSKKCTIQSYKELWKVRVDIAPLADGSGRLLGGGGVSVRFLVKCNKKPSQQAVNHEDTCWLTQLDAERYPGLT